MVRMVSGTQAGDNAELCSIPPFSPAPAGRFKPCRYRSLICSQGEKMEGVTMCAENGSGLRTGFLAVVSLSICGPKP